MQLQERARLEEELAGARARHKRVSNAHAPPSKGSDAQHSLAKYRKGNKANYQSGKEERKESKQSGGPRKKPLPVTKNVDLTVGKCPGCDVDAKVKTETKDAVDIQRVPKAGKTQYRIQGQVRERPQDQHDAKRLYGRPHSRRKRGWSGHKINTTPRGLTRGSAFGPNLMTQIVFPFFTTPGLGPTAKAL